MSSPSQKFKAILGPGGKHGDVAFVKVPFDVKDVWGRGIVPVRGTINGVAFRTTVGRKADAYCFCVNTHMRAKTSLTVGDIAAFAMEPDLAPRIVAIPPALRKGLGTQLQSRPKSLAYTHQK